MVGDTDRVSATSLTRDPGGGVTLRLSAPDCAACDRARLRGTNGKDVSQGSHSRSQCPTHRRSIHLHDYRSDALVIARTDGSPLMDEFLDFAYTSAFPYWATDVLHPDVGWDLDAAAAQGPERLAAAAVRAMTWNRNDFTPSDAEQWEASGLDPTAAAQWRFFEVEDALAWRAVVDEAIVAEGWRTAGFTPDTLPPGFVDVHAWDFAVLVTDEEDPDPRWAPTPSADPAPTASLVRVGFRQGQDPEDVMALLDQVLRGPHDEDPARLATTLDDALAGRNWGDVAACLQVRMALPEALAFLDSGADMAPVRVMAALTG